MSVSISQLLTMPNDSIGSEKWSASPYFIDFVALAIIGSAIVSRSEGLIRIGAIYKGRLFGNLGGVGCQTIATLYSGYTEI